MVLRAPSRVLSGQCRADTRVKPAGCQPSAEASGPWLARPGDVQQGIARGWLRGRGHAAKLRHIPAPPPRPWRPCACCSLWCRLLAASQPPSHHQRPAELRPRARPPPAQPRSPPSTSRHRELTSEEANNIPAAMATGGDVWRNAGASLTRMLQGPDPSDPEARVPVPCEPTLGTAEPRAARLGEPVTRGLPAPATWPVQSDRLARHPAGAGAGGSPW